ncbi:MAG TPA: S41 family peptidase [Terriglobales bacterium]|nr:S41 family peptidase [Terriglobales bacterium]
MIQRTRLVAFVVSVLCVFCCGLFAQSSTSISLQERVMMTSRIYHVVSTFFPGLSQDKFDAAYEKYLSTILRTEDRRAFDLASMEFVADLHDGHTWFYDKWLDQNHGAPIGILAYPVSGKWTVVRSQLDSIHVGDVIASVDDASADEWFVRNRRYLSASSDRDASVSFFDTPALFPEQFTITLGDGRKVPIDRKNDKKQPLPAVKTEGKWLVPNSVAYVKVPTFHGIETQAQALEFLKQYHDAKTLILDVRGNPGTGAPGVLQRALMVKPYQDWNEASSEHGGALLRNYPPAYPGHSTLVITDTIIEPRDTAYSGRLILLTDRVCSCACEDFVMPFKFARRATLVGETTAGTYSMTRHLDLENGMMLNISAVRHTFPDGSQFEGVGITPDVPVENSAEDLRAGRDAVLKKAVEIAQGP